MDGTTALPVQTPRPGRQRGNGSSIVRACLPAPDQERRSDDPGHIRSAGQSLHGEQFAVPAPTHTLA
jgi:hypothetical protein